MNKIRWNAWTCQKCGQHTICVDVDRGVTPFMLRCRASDGCDGMATSAFYPDYAIPPGVPRWEWYRPGRLHRLFISRWEREHVKKGGLLLRPRTRRKPIIEPMRRKTA